MESRRLLGPGHLTSHPYSGAINGGGYESIDHEIVSLLHDGNSTECADPDIQVVSPPQGEGSTWYASVFIVVNAALGAGLLNFPQAFDQSGGIAVAVIIQAVLMVFIIGALLILAYCSDVHDSSTYQDVVQSMCGQHAQTACSAIIVIYSYGVCITFFIIIGDQMDKFLSFVYGDTFCETWYMNRKFTITVSAVLFVWPMCYARRIDFLKYASTAGVLAVVYCVVLVCVKYYTDDLHPGPIKTQPENWTDVFLVVPVICFAYQCHISVVPVYACLRTRTQREFIKTVMVALAICVFAYTGTASFGYLTFGGRVKADILSSYPPTWDVLVAVILIAVKMVTTYPILLYVGRAGFESVWSQVFGVSQVFWVSSVAVGERGRRVAVTTVWFVSSLALAVIVPDIHSVIAVLGGLAALFIFTFPGLCLLQVLLQGYVTYARSKVQYVLLMAMAAGYLIIGAFVFGLVTTQSIWNDVAPPHPRAAQDTLSQYRRFPTLLGAQTHVC